MLTKLKDYARLTGIFIGAVILFVRLCFGFKLPEPPIVEEPKPEPPPEKIFVDPMIMSVKDLFVNGQYTATKFDFEAVKEFMLRGAGYFHSALQQSNLTIERLPVALYNYTYGRETAVMIYVDFVPSTEGIVPVMQKDQEEKLRRFGRNVTCFLN